MKHTIPQYNTKNHGVTILEVLLSMAIFIAITAVVYSNIIVTRRVIAQAEGNQEILNSSRDIFDILRRELHSPNVCNIDTSVLGTITIYRYNPDKSCATVTNPENIRKYVYNSDNKNLKIGYTTGEAPKNNTLHPDNILITSWEIIPHKSADGTKLYGIKISYAFTKTPGKSGKYINYAGKIFLANASGS